MNMILQTVIAGLGAGTYTFSATALCGATESAPSNEVEVAIDLAPPHNFNAQIVSSGVICTWQQPLDTTNVTAFIIYRNGVQIGSSEFLAYLDSNLPAGIYKYHATAIYTSMYESPASNTEEINTVGNSDLNLTPLSNQLLGINPNPFNPSTKISFSLASKDCHELCIYNLKGEKIKTLDSETKQPGVYSALWNGVDDSGRKVPSGIYIARLKAQNQYSSKKLILLK